MFFFVKQKPQNQTHTLDLNINKIKIILYNRLKYKKLTNFSLFEISKIK